MNIRSIYRNLHWPKTYPLKSSQESSEIKNCQLPSSRKVKSSSLLTRMILLSPGILWANCVGSWYPEVEFIASRMRWRWYRGREKAQLNTTAPEASFCALQEISPSLTRFSAGSKSPQNTFWSYLQLSNYLFHCLHTCWPGVDRCLVNRNLVDRPFFVAQMIGRSLTSNVLDRCCARSTVPLRTLCQQPQAKPEPKFVQMKPPGDDKIRDVCVHCSFINYKNPKIVVGTVSTWK